jgi:two-component system LytT family sensor kinase
MWQRKWARRFLVLGIWIFVGLYFSVQVYLQQSNENQSISIGRALYNGLVFWIMWAFFSPLIIWLARNYRVTREQWLDSMLFHIPTGVIFSLLHLTAYVLVTTWHEGGVGSFAILIENLRRVFSASFVWWSTAYWTILISIHAFDYYQDYQQGLLKSSQLEARLAQSQLQALKMQLHPHFLFNTLNSISALLHDDVEAADKMIARLGDFLRLTLDNSGAQQVTLGRELEFLDCYLEIEQLRFQDRMKTKVSIEPEALKAMVPNLFLQPIVENAIRHGIAHGDGPGQIEIRARQQADQLQVQVKDSGPGLGKNGSGELITKEGIGLTNTRTRMQQLYGDKYRFDMTNAPEGGLVVTLEIPFQLESLNGNGASHG